MSGPELVLVLRYRKAVTYGFHVLFPPDRLQHARRPCSSVEIGRHGLPGVAITLALRDLAYRDDPLVTGLALLVSPFLAKKP